MEMQVENCNGLANAVAYLHTALSRPFIHPDIRSLNTILDQDNVPKLIDFSLSNSIHEGQSHVEGIVGVGGGGWVGGLVWGVAWGGFVVGWRVSTFAPDQALMGYLTEKADVHSFGKILFQLLRGQRPSYYINVDSIVLDSVKHWVENNQFSRVVDHRIAIEGIEQEQLLDFTTLARDGEERPKIIKVARELSLFN
ncbi:hypothetical protein SCA6_002489 [Theobroma cacao]